MLDTLIFRRKSKKTHELATDTSIEVETTLNEPSLVDISLSPQQSTENLMLLNTDNNNLHSDIVNADFVEEEMPDFEIEKTDEGPSPTVFCAIPSCIFTCFFPTISSNDSARHNPNRINSDRRYKRKAEHEICRSNSTSRSVSPNRSESIDGNSSMSPLKPAKFVAPRMLSHRSTAGSSVQLLSEASVSRLPAKYSHTYCTHADAKTFSLRCGPNYKRNGFKKPSEESFMELVGAE